MSSITSEDDQTEAGANGGILTKSVEETNSRQSFDNQKKGGEPCTAKSDQGKNNNANMAD